MFEEIVIDEGLLVLGWRDVPTDDRDLGPSAVAVRAGVPADFRRARARRAGAGGVTRGRRASSSASSTSIRKRIEHAVDSSDLPPAEKRFFYVVEPVVEHA